MPAPAPFSAVVVPGSPGRVCVVILTGRLDPPAADALQAKLDQLYDAGERRFVLDLSKLSYLGSLGVGVFVRLANKVKCSGAAALSAPSPQVGEVLDLVRIGSVVPVYPTRPAAVEAVGTA